jgi:hypothetical protein
MLGRSVQAGDLSLVLSTTVRYTGKVRSLVNAMSRTSGVAEEFYGRVVGESGPYLKHVFALA